MIGDHDVKDDPLATGFRRHVGEPYGTISLHGFRFIRLNTQESRPVGLSAEQIDWFRGEVDSALAEGERVVIFQHNYPYQIWEDFDGPGIDDWRAIVQTRRDRGDRLRAHPLLASRQRRPERRDRHPLDWCADLGMGSRWTVGERQDVNIDLIAPEFHHWAELPRSAGGFSLIAAAAPRVLLL